ncbi:MAG: ATP synthase F1 subunit delta [Terriglobales bacterium]
MASVVGTYARAFADVVMSTKADPTRMLAELHSMQAILAESADLRRVLDNPSIPGGQKNAVIDAIVQKVGVSRPVRNFMAVVTDHHRLALFSEIVKQVERELNERFGFAEAQVTSARLLNDPEKQLLEAEIATLTGKKVRARYQQDKSLLGGAVVQVGSTIYDGSVNGQLERIREQLVS